MEGVPGVCGNSKLRIRELRKTYGSVAALDNVDLDLREGEFLTVLGPSGSGKSTLLWAVAGLNAPDSGAIWIDGKEATYASPADRDIGMVFQNYALFPHMTVAENISFPLEMRKVAKSDRGRAIAEALEMVKLPNVSARFPRELSGGQQQRIALARAFVSGPSIVLMDEPLGALDKKLRDHLQLEIKQIHERLRTSVLYVTHDQEEAMVMSDRICLMNAGRIEQIGTPDELYSRPVSLFAADFLGESNMISGTVVKSDEGSGKVAVALDGIGTISVASTCALTEGLRVVHMTRPESLAIADCADSYANSVTARVVNVIVSGAMTRIYADVESGSVMQITQLTDGRPRPRKGEPIRIGWPAETGVLFPSSGEGQS